MALKHCFSGTNGVPSQRIGKAAPQPAAGKVACALSGPPLGTATEIKVKMGKRTTDDMAAACTRFIVAKMEEVATPKPRATCILATYGGFSTGLAHVEQDVYLNETSAGRVALITHQALATRRRNHPDFTWQVDDESGDVWALQLALTCDGDVTEEQSKRLLTVAKMVERDVVEYLQWGRSGPKILHSAF